MTTRLPPGGLPLAWALDVLITDGPLLEQLKMYRFAEAQQTEAFLRPMRKNIWSHLVARAEIDGEFRIHGYMPGETTLKRIPTALLKTSAALAGFDDIETKAGQFVAVTLLPIGSDVARVDPKPKKTKTPAPPVADAEPADQNSKKEPADTGRPGPGIPVDPPPLEIGDPSTQKTAAEKPTRGRGRPSGMSFILEDFERIGDQIEGSLAAQARLLEQRHSKNHPEERQPSADRIATVIRKRYAERKAHKNTAKNTAKIGKTPRKE